MVLQLQFTYPSSEASKKLFLLSRSLSFLLTRLVIIKRAFIMAITIHVALLLHIGVELMLHVLQMTGRLQYQRILRSCMRLLAIIQRLPQSNLYVFVEKLGRILKPQISRYGNYLSRVLLRKYSWSKSVLLITKN